MKTIERIATLLAMTLLVTGFLSSNLTHGQETTERYIPIGKSPGVSDKSSYIGTITAVDMDAHTIDIDSNRGDVTIEITEDTRIWLDRSEAKRSNAVGSYSDCQVGRKVEVMHIRGDETVADWIKIESQ